MLFAVSCITCIMQWPLIAVRAALSRHTTCIGMPAPCNQSLGVYEAISAMEVDHCHDGVCTFEVVECVSLPFLDKSL